MNKQSLSNLLARTPPFSAVPKNDLQLLADRLEVTSLVSDQSYHLEKGAQTIYLLPLKGLLVLQKEHTDRMCPVYIRLPIGGLWPVASGVDVDVAMRVEAIGTALLAILSHTAFSEIGVTSEKLSLALVQSAGLVLMQLTKQYGLRVQVPLATRMANLFLELKEPKGGRLFVPYSHQQLAILLSTYRETVSTLISQFRRRGWIETGRKEIQLLDIDALSKMAKKY